MIFLPLKKQKQKIKSNLTTLNFIRPKKLKLAGCPRYQERKNFRQIICLLLLQTFIVAFLLNISFSVLSSFSIFLDPRVGLILGGQ